MLIAESSLLILVVLPSSHFTVTVDLFMPTLYLTVDLFMPTLYHTQSDLQGISSVFVVYLGELLM